MMDCLSTRAMACARVTLLAVLLMARFLPTYAANAPLPSVTVTSVAVEDDSVKVTINPASCPTAADFRIMDVSNPATVKYFGLWHLTAGWSGNILVFAQNAKGNVIYPPKTVAPTTQTVNGSVTVPAWEVQWNGLTPGQPVTLVVQAVDAVGPFPPGNLYDTATDLPLQACTDGMCMLGSNHGITLDGLESINGQGPSTDIPAVIAQSAPFTVTPLANTVPIPSGTDATSSFMERFPSATFTSVATLLPGPDEASWLMTTATTASNTGHAWDVEAHSVDTNLTRPFVADTHYMDILSDGGTIGKSSNPPHVAHASISISPQQTVSFAGGQILHITGEWDAHEDPRRWTGIGVFPANDRALSQDPSDYAINSSDTAFVTEILQTGVNFEDCLGPTTAGSAPVVSLKTGNRPYLFGPKMKPTLWSSTRGPVVAPANTGADYDQIASGFDDRRRYDLFLSQTHAAFYEDGIKVIDYALPKPLSFTTAKVYYTHYVYHLALDHTELGEYEPWEAFWLDTVPYSDERHWDDCGYEVLPATTSWSTLKTLCQPVDAVAPTPAP